MRNFDRYTATLTVAAVSIACAADERDATPSLDADGGARESDGGTVPFDPASTRDGSEGFFDQGRLHHVDITMSADDWSALGREGRSLAIASCDGFDVTSPFEYTYFSAALDVDGESLGSVGLRKKGFLGSLMITKPSLKVDFNRVIAGAEFFGLGRLTLNNNKQDSALIRQCVTYDLYRAAGVPASRCDFAEVTVNGEILGVYSNVESIGERFLRRRFANATGNLYEGQGADFVDGRWELFQVKTNDATNDRSDVRALTDALKSDDADLLAALEPLLNVDRFLTYWAMEALTASWDSYSTLGNNFWLYNDPDTGFEFIPWGTDATLDVAGLTGDARLQHVSTDSSLSKRLYALPEVRDRYFERLRELLDEVWNEDALISKIDALESLVGTADAAAIEQIREFVRGRRAVIEAELASDTTEHVSGDICFTRGASVVGTFSGMWGTAATAGVAPTATLELDGAPVAMTDVSVVAAMGLNPVVAGAPGVSITGTVSGGESFTLTIAVEEPLYAAGEVPLHAIADVGFVINPGALTGEPAPFAFVSDGSIRFEAAGLTDGAAVSGSFDGHLYSFGERTR